MSKVSACHRARQWDCNAADEKHGNANHRCQLHRSRAHRIDFQVHQSTVNSPSMPFMKCGGPLPSAPLTLPSATKQAYT